MARLARITYDGIIYHAVQRGNNKQNIFSDNNDYIVFKNIIKKYKNKYLFELYNYCLMPNHIHLLIKFLRKEEIAKFFQGLFQSFQFHHRRKYDYVGMLYQNRYKSIPVEKDSYLLECARYIERNPLRAGIVDLLHDYKWSSYNFYALGQSDPVVTPNPLYMELAGLPQKREKLYIEYLTKERPYEMLLEKKIEVLR